MRIFSFIIICLFYLAACNSPSNQHQNKPTMITVKSVDLFNGDSAKLKPFIGSMTGAFNLSYTGAKPKANLNIDIWKNGKKDSSVGGLHDIFFNIDESSKRNVEVIFSINEFSFEGVDPFNQVKVNVAHDSGSSLYTISSPYDKDLKAKGLFITPKERTFNSEEDIILGGMQATSTNSIYTADVSPESLSKIEWAIVFSLHFEKE